MVRKEFRDIIEEANCVVDRCYARAARTFDRSMSELADQRDYVEYARKQVEDEGVTYPGKEFKEVPIIIILWILLAHAIDRATAGALCEASGMVVVLVFAGAAFVAVPVGLILSALINKLVAWQNVEECGQALYRIDSCVGSLVEKRQATMKKESANGVDSGTPVDGVVSDAPVDEADSDASVVSDAPVVSNAPIDE